MKKIGILGGVGWRAGAEYYAGLCRLGEAWRSQADKSTVSPMQEMSIESLDQATAIACRRRSGLIARSFRESMREKPTQPSCQQAGSSLDQRLR